MNTCDEVHEIHEYMTSRPVRSAALQQPRARTAEPALRGTRGAGRRVPDSLSDSFNDTLKDSRNDSFTDSRTENAATTTTTTITPTTAKTYTSISIYTYIYIYIEYSYLG